MPEFQAWSGLRGCSSPLSGALGPVYKRRAQLPRAGPSSPRLWLSPVTSQVWRSDVEDSTP